MRTTLLSAALLATGIVSAATPVDGWYSSVFGGYAYIPANIGRNHLSFLYLDETGYKGGYNAGGRIGFQSNPLRYEAEYTYLKNDLRHFSVNYADQYGVHGYSSGNFLMANVYYDFPDMLPTISPYLGFGLGYAYLQTYLAATGPEFWTNISLSDNAFAYQGTAGITYNFAENYAINLAYRYVSTSKVDEFGSVFQAHIANVGIIYRFDQLNYK